ncbi:MAG: nickel-dependent hydrogenase large subunit [Gallionellaceae bacterium]|nr:nickel-dependent hydrogenase large subunit [Gallionellaceae bacterium]
MIGIPEGRIEIGLGRRKGSTPEVGIRSTRQPLAQKLLAGQTPERAAQLVGLLFSLCGQAQRAAAELAIAAAAGTQADSTRFSHQVLAELAREHAWRLLLDWPRQEGLPEQMEALRRLRLAGDTVAEQTGALHQLLSETLLGEPAGHWLKQVSGPAGLVVFDAWRNRAATPLATLFGRLGGRDSGFGRQPLLRSLARLGSAPVIDIGLRALADEDFCMRPRLAGGSMETGALGRCQGEPLVLAWTAEYGPGVGARMLARLLELARLPERLADDGAEVAAAWSPAPGTGVAAVETSRGLLIHALTLVDGRIAQYRIVAPTEWNFQPGGPLEAALRAQPDGDDLAQRARGMALAMDPCVDWRVEVDDA